MALVIFSLIGLYGLVWLCVMVWAAKKDNRLYGGLNEADARLAGGTALACIVIMAVGIVGVIYSLTGVGSGL